MPQPKPNGRAMPASPTLRAIFQLDKSKRKSTSNPTKNRKSIKPTLAAMERVGMEAVGKMCSVKPGIRPKTEGPRRMPPMTSAMTRGWRILERGKWRIRQKMMMMAALKITLDISMVSIYEERTVSYLNDEDDDWILWIILGGIGPLKDATLPSYLHHCHDEAGMRGVSQTDRDKKGQQKNARWLEAEGVRHESRSNAAHTDDRG